jgi:flavin-dependent dehydrogenase
MDGDTYIYDVSNVVITKRTKFDHIIYKIAKESGATTMNREVLNVNISKSRCVIKTKNSTLNSKFVIAADGVNSAIKRKFIKTKRETAVLLKGNIKLPPTTIKKIIDMGYGYFGKLIPNQKGYGWIFAQKSSLNIGFGNSTGMNIKQNFLDFVSFLKKNIIIPNKSKIQNLKPGLIQFNPNLKDLVSARIIYCGDAGGFVHPLIGEGIPYAMLSGKFAAQTITKAFDKNQFSKEFLNDTYLGLLKDILEDFKLGVKIRDIVVKYRLHKLANLFSGSIPKYLVDSEIGSLNLINLLPIK